MDVAALYVDTASGPYPGIEGVECWGADRDAAAYQGQFPVIAHPPCTTWGRLRSMVQFTASSRALRYLGPLAVTQVLRHGGVLEHPERSDMWRHCSLPSPYYEYPSDDFTRSSRAPWALCINQYDFGHMSTKPTWLLFCGISPRDLPPLPPERQGIPVPWEEIPHAKRHLTPPDLAHWLVAAARQARPQEKAPA